MADKANAKTGNASSTKKRAKAKRVRLQKVGRAASREKQAIALLNEWVKSGREIEMIVGYGIVFTGHLDLLSTGLGSEGFLFKTPYGVHCLIFPMLYDNITVEDVGPLAPTIHLQDSRDGMKRATFRIRKEWVSEGQINQVCEQFRTWSKLGTNVRVMEGDGLHSVVFDATILERSNRLYCFVAKVGGTTHVVDPSKSGIVKFQTAETSTVIQLFNLTSQTIFIVTDALETPEQVMERFAQVTKLIQ